jgi:hypothetical protein
MLRESTAHKVFRFHLVESIKEIHDSICKPFKESWNQFPAWRAFSTTLFNLFYIAARQATHMLAESIPGILKRLLIRALVSVLPLQTQIIMHLVCTVTRGSTGSSAIGKAFLLIRYFINKNKWKKLVESWT